MTAEIDQLRNIDVEDFSYITAGDRIWLQLTPKDSSISASGAVNISDDINVQTKFKRWLQAWNIEELITITTSESTPLIKASLTREDKEVFNYLREKLVRCKMYAINYYENKLFDELR